MKPFTHYPDPLKPTAGICGAGYSWPSSISLKRTKEQIVTCPDCLRILS